MMQKYKCKSSDSRSEEERDAGYRAHSIGLKFPTLLVKKAQQVTI
jgi:hypothetical protein